jgi:hypothetical protein
VRNRGLLIGLGVGCLVLGGCTALVVALGFGSLSAIGSAIEAPSDIDLGVIAPATVQLNEGFSILVRIRNLAAQQQSLDSIDIADGYLAGVAIQGSDPGYSDAYSIFGYQSHTYRIPIPAGTELIVQFRAVAVQAGDFRGDMDVCINTGTHCLTRPLRTVVSP